MARPQNVILADIVAATGGTVTDPHNRNRLMQDWLDSLSNITRYFTRLSIGDSSHYTLATTDTFSGDFRVSYSTILVDTEMDFADGFGIDASGNYKAPASVTDILQNGVSVGLGSGAVLDATITEVIFVGAVNVSITGFGQSGSGTNYFEGILLDPSTPNIKYTLGEESSATEASSTGNNLLTYVTPASRLEYAKEVGGWVSGENLLTSTPTLGSYWVDNGDGSYTIDAPDGAFNLLRFTDVNPTAGVIYRVTGNLTLTTGADRIALYSTTQNAPSQFTTLPAIAGDFASYVTSDNSLFPSFVRGSGFGAFSQTISDIEVHIGLKTTPRISWTNTTNLGINVHTFGYYTPNAPFIDRMKSASPKWLFDNNADAAMHVDNAGWIANLPAGTRLRKYVIIHNNTFVNPGRYVITWGGAADVEVKSFASVNRNHLVEGPNRISVEIFNPVNLADINVVEQLTILVTNNTASSISISNIKVFREDEESLLNAGEIFSPDMYQYWENMSTFRFMDWLKTNDSDVVNFSQYSLEGDCTWTGVGSKSFSVPLSVCAKLAMKFNADMWVNIPHKASDTLAADMAQAIHTVAPNMKVYCEFSNEIWNSQFQQHSYIRDTLASNYTSSGDYWTKIRYGQACRSSDLLTIFKSNKSNVVSVLGGWLNGLDEVFPMLDIDYNGLISDQIDEYSITGYFGAPATTLEMIEGELYNNSDAWWGTQLRGAIENTTSYIAANALALDNYPAVKMSLYELGQHLAPSRETPYTFTLNNTTNRIVYNGGSLDGLFVDGNTVVLAYISSGELFAGSDHFHEYYIRRVGGNELSVYDSEANYLSNSPVTLSTSITSISLGNETRWRALSSRLSDINSSELMGDLYSALITRIRNAGGPAVICQFTECGGWTTISDEKLISAVGGYWGLDSYPGQSTPKAESYLTLAEDNPNGLPPLIRGY